MSRIHPDYPAPAELDAWCERILAGARARGLMAHTVDAPVYDFKLGVRHTGGQYLAFESAGEETFYGFWQPAPTGPGPLLLHVPGYGAEMSAHPELVSDGYSVLHINPRGYATPDGPSTGKQTNDTWPVLPDTVTTLGEGGYVDWLTDAAAAAIWALGQQNVQPERFAFFGTSQGGGAALLLTSIFAGEGVRCVAADVPFLTNFPMLEDAGDKGAYELSFTALAQIADQRPQDLPAAWRALGFVDTLSHAHRLRMPVLLLSGLEDTVCPPESIMALFDALPGTRSLTEVEGQAHCYTLPFLPMARAWFRSFL